MKRKDFSQFLSINPQYHQLIETMLNGYAVNEIILDYKHEPVDYRFLEVNSAFEALTGFTRQQVIGKTILDLMPETKQEWIEICADVALNQKDICTEYYSDILKRYYQVRIISHEKGVFLTIFNDISSLKEAHEELERRKKSYQMFFDGIQVGLIRTTVNEGKIIKANPASAHLFGFDDLESFMQTSVTEFYKHPEDRKKYRTKLLRNGKLNHAVLQMQKVNKKPLTIAVSSTVHYENNLPVWIDSTIQDISKQRRAEERLQTNSIVFEHTLEAVVISDEEHKILTVNKAFTDITGYTKKEVVGKDFNLLWCSDEKQADQSNNILFELLTKGSWQGEVHQRHKDGHQFPAHLSVIEGERSKDTKHYISIFYDITYRKQSEEKLYQLAHFDPLTKLSNRHAFLNRLEESIARAKRYEKKCAVFFMDLDGFKAINDTYGHNAGDEVLKITASRLKKTIRKSDMLARLGGDEFTVIIENETETRSLNILAQKMINAVSQDIRLKEAIVSITTSIGISIYPDDALDLESVLKHADNAMYRAKELGKNNVQYFTKELNIDSVNQMIFEMELRHALEKDEMQIYYQPRVHLHTKKIIGFEAILRWENETYGVVKPEVFLPVAMQSEFINKICSWLLHASLSQVKKWQEKFERPFSLSFMLPNKQLLNEEFITELQKTLETIDYDASLLHIQVQQDALMQSNLYESVQRFHLLGIKLIVNNFGMGVSSIADLYKLPLHGLKIHKKFVHHTTEEDAATLKVLIELAHTLKTEVIASSVDSSDIFEELRKLNVQLVQGDHLHPAMPPHETLLEISRSNY